jgi:aminoglycoside 3-N-acetyltransferase I
MPRTEDDALQPTLRRLSASDVDMVKAAFRMMAEVYDIAVHPDQQRQGVGRQLVDALRDEAARAGIVDVFVLADNDDLHALDFYRALGARADAVTMFSFNTAPDRHDT